MTLHERLCQKQRLQRELRPSCCRWLTDTPVSIPGPCYPWYQVDYGYQVPVAPSDGELQTEFCIFALVYANDSFSLFPILLVMISE